MKTITEIRGRPSRFATGVENPIQLSYICHMRSRARRDEFFFKFFFQALITLSPQTYRRVTRTMAPHTPTPDSQTPLCASAASGEVASRRTASADSYAPARCERSEAKTASFGHTRRDREKFVGGPPTPAWCFANTSRPQNRSRKLCPYSVVVVINLQPPPGR